MNNHTLAFLVSIIASLLISLSFGLFLIYLEDKWSHGWFIATFVIFFIHIYSVMTKKNNTEEESLPINLWLQKLFKITVVTGIVVSGIIFAVYLFDSLLNSAYDVDSDGFWETIIPFGLFLWISMFISISSVMIYRRFSK